MLQKFKFIFCLFCCLAASFSINNISAQTHLSPIELRFGSAVQDQLRVGQEIWYSVTPSADAMITVKTMGNTNTFLELYDATYDLLTMDDDSGEGTNAAIEFFAQGGETLYIKLRGANDHIRGQFRIQADLELVPQDTERNTSRARAAQLLTGESVTVFFRSNLESRWFRFDAPWNGITLTVQTRGTMDTILNLYDNFGNLIAHDDDSGEYFNALIQETLDRGVYLIEVKEFSGEMGRTILHSDMR